MNGSAIRAHCLSLPYVTEHVQWGDNLVFKIGREQLGDGAKIFAIASLEPGEGLVSFKCTPEEFAELVEMPGIIPAPYLARAYWVSIQNEDALPGRELAQRLTHSHELILGALPKSKQALIRGDVSLTTKVPVRKKAMPERRAVARNKK